MQKKLDLTKIGVIGACVLLIAGGTAAAFKMNAQDNQLDDIKDSIVKLGEPTVVETEEVIVPTQLDEVQAEVDAIKLKLFEEDAWEAQAEVLALEEIEDDDYEVLYDFMTDPAGLNLSIDDAEDIETVIVKDVTVVGDAEDKDASVTHELKVYYEDSEGDDKKVYLTVETDIDDDDVEDTIVSETL